MYNKVLTVGNMKGKLVWTFSLLPLLYTVYCERCSSEENHVRILKNEIHDLNNNILTQVNINYVAENTANRLRAEDNFLNKKLSKLQETNDRHINKITSLHSQLNELNKSKEILKDYGKNLEVSLRNKVKLIRRLEARNQNLRGEAESLNSEFLGLKENPKRISSGSYARSLSWQRILLFASEIGDVNGVKYLIDKGVDVNVRDDSPQHRTPLLTAAASGHAEVVEQLLNAGASLEQTSSSLNTALHEAASAGNLKVCQLLLDRKAKLEPLNKNKDTPLKLAKNNGHQNIVDLLVKKGAKF